ncbi:30S ribosomal protein S9 [Candidatus Woesearchaeota archaeon]|nr:30S ribosomal protein S9 [Candidatus Woesearchaeota archaeon]
MKKIVHESGSRKRAIARATVKEGSGVVKVNNILLENFEPRLARMKIKEPLLIADNISDKVDISVKVSGGGYMAQADAARLAIARALVGFVKGDSLKNVFLKYDRHMLVADVRRKEMCKPNDSKARAKRQKSYR